MKRKFLHPLLLVFLIALALRLFWFFIVLVKNPSGFLFFDSWGYWRIAHNLAKYGVFSQGTLNTLIPDSIRTPLYPLFILFLNPCIGFYGILIVQVFLGAATCSVTYYLGYEILNHKKAALVAGLLTALDFPSIMFSSVLLTETLFTFLIISCIACFIRYLKNGQYNLLVFSSILLGLSILCRPIALMLPVLFGIFIFFQSPFLVQKKSLFLFLKNHWKPAFLFISISCLIIAPWIIRNKITFGRPFISTVAEVNLLFYTGARIKAAQEGKKVEEVQNEYKGFVAENFNWKLPEETVRFTEYSKKEALVRIFNHPEKFITYYAEAFCYFFLKPLRNYIDMQLGVQTGYESLTSNEIPSGFKQFFYKTGNVAIGLVFYQFLFLITIYLLTAILIIKKKAFGKPMLFAIGVVFYFASLSSFTAEVDARLRVPVMPLLCLIAAGGASQLFKFTRINPS